MQLVAVMDTVKPVKACASIRYNDDDDMWLQVADPWGGSYMMETLTNEICEKALEVIKEVRSYLLLDNLLIFRLSNHR